MRSAYSINLLTLLALVLCIGLVVDDAIVVLENIQRRVDLGEPPLVAAQRGTAQVAFAVLATTAVLVAVFLPVGFLEGNTGRLFRELSVALAAAVAISAFVALTLTPMMASKLLRPHTGPHAVKKTGSTVLAQRALRAPGRRSYRRARAARGIHLVVRLADDRRVRGDESCCSSWLPSELAPAEDRGVVP
jgi:multidrug efflux pump